MLGGLGRWAEVNLTSENEYMLPTSNGAEEGIIK